MRILFMHHFPPAASAEGRLVQRWQRALADGGHETRALIIDSQQGESKSFDAQTIVCNAKDPAADLPFDVPRFGDSGAANRTAFTSLSDYQLSQYRETIRRRLDAEIESFNPDVIHGQHVWVQGQLALETGVPYLLNAWGGELVDYQRDPRYRALVSQAAENAGRILVADEEMRGAVSRVFEIGMERIVLMPSELVSSEVDATQPGNGQIAGALLALYEQVLAERFGS